MADLEQPLWLPDTYKRLDSTDVPDLTYPYRGSVASRALEAKLVRNPVSTLNFLEIGIGGGDGVLSCPYEPYFITAELEKNGIEYTGLIVDIDETIIKNFINRTKIFYPYSYYQDNIYQGKDAWDHYLDNTGQELSVTHNYNPQMVFRNIIKKLPGSSSIAKTSSLREGILTASIPSQLGPKIINGEVSIVKEDIAAVDLTKYPPFDFVSFLNVLHYLDSDGQKLALFNISKHMAEGGFLVMDDSFWSPTMAEIGGWMDRKEMIDLKLEPVIDGYIDEWQRTRILQKVA